MPWTHLIELRKKTKLSQEELAERIGVSQKSISKYEQQTVRPSWEALIAMADLFNVTVDYLLGRSDMPEHLSAEPSSYSPSAPLEPDTQKILNTFSMLNEDNRDILIGEAKKLLKQQRLEEKRAAVPAAKAT